MAQFHAEPNRSTPNTHMWFSVETTSIFKEYKLPASDTDWNSVDVGKFSELERLAERHGTYVRRSSYRRG